MPGFEVKLIKSIYKAAKAGKNAWKAVFLPWSARPERTPAWYEAQRRDALANEGSLDSVHEQYQRRSTGLLQRHRRP